LRAAGLRGGVRGVLSSRPYIKDQDGRVKEPNSGLRAGKIKTPGGKGKRG